MPLDPDVEVTFKVEVEGTDVTDYIINEGSFIPNAVDRVTTNNFYLHIDTPLVPQEFDDVSFYVKYDSYFKKFGGVISTVVKDEANFRYRIEVKSYDWLAYRTEYTGVFRADTGKGNIKTVVTDILTEKFPDATWDSSSFPDVDSEFNIIYKTYTNRKVGDLFDELAQSTQRNWWFDKNFKFHFKERVYTFYNNPIIYGTNTIGQPIVDKDTTNYANIVKVYGAKLDKEYVDTFSGTGTLNAFTLTYFPTAVRSIEYTSGTKISYTMEGVTDYSTTLYNAYLRPALPGIKFNTNTVSGTNNIKVYYNIIDQVYDEFGLGASIESSNIEVVKSINNEDITSQEEAFNIAKAELANSVAIDIVTTQIRIENQDDVEQYSVGNNVPVQIGSINESLDILEENWRFSKSTGLTCTLRLNGSRRTDNDVLVDFMKRIKQKEDKEALSRGTTVRYFYWGGNIYLEFSKLSIESQQSDEDAFELQETNQDYRSLMLETGGTVVMKEDYTLYPKEIILAHNYNNLYDERFMDNWYIKENPGVTLNSSSNRLEIASGTIAESREVFYDGDSSSYIRDITFENIEGTNTVNCVVLLTGSSTLSYSACSLGSTITYPIGQRGNKILYKIQNTGGSQALITRFKLSYNVDRV